MSVKWISRIGGIRHKMKTHRIFQTFLEEKLDEWDKIEQIKLIGEAQEDWQKCVRRVGGMVGSSGIDISSK